ncbi:MAG: ATP-dependent RNA helicase HrpA [Acidobacteria bacterium]|nr:ATP-dependent RNA helicase HrpA [Acidobacteriota bacterium]
MLKDQALLIDRLQVLRQKSRRTGMAAILSDLLNLETRMERSIQIRADRKNRLPHVSFPGELPISGRAADIISAIRENRVVILSGETGCGKSTQIPKMCLKAGRGLSGQIACTQPRRIAAITIAHRIAEELGEGIGLSVGYKIRFREKASPETFIKVVTDGMLLAETQGDPRLFTYDTIIIDEAHERSLNIDFLLGIMRNLLDVRPDLKLIITSATLDTEKFSKAFENAPIIQVSGRMYPVTIEYRSPGPKGTATDETDYVETAVKAVHDIKAKKKPGDILVFMPTEQDIIETCDKLEGKQFAGTTVLPLYARLPGTQQGRVYHVSGPKIVVATNVAETSLTIPGIRYVVDTGLARISRYIPGTRTHSLPVSAISRSSADQRAGRCGRVEEGVCIRLYERQDYEKRPLYTLPEIQRSNLAEVILRMIDLGLDHPSVFPFVDHPKPKHIKDGYDLLLELGGIQKEGRSYTLTKRGRLMARMPLDPQISRMLIEAQKEGVLREVAVIASALSIRDPRERPPEKAAQADQKHAPFRHPDSDFLTLLNIWDTYNGSWEKLKSQNQKRKFCLTHFLSYPRMREWTFIHDQIRDILKELRVPVEEGDRKTITPRLAAAVHRCVLSGYLSNIAVHKEKNMYQAAKGRDVMLFPGSTLFNHPPPWIVAAEMVETSRLFAKKTARIDPAWLEALGGDLCRSSYSEPFWDKKQGDVYAEERVTLFGLQIISGRRKAYGPINPEAAHEVFVQSALIEGHVDRPFSFLQANLYLVRRLQVMEDKLRRRDILIPEDELAGFYSQRLQGVYNVRGLESRIREKGGEAFLRLTEEDLLRLRPGQDLLSLFPDEMTLEDRTFRAEYAFDPGEKADGITIKVPAAQVPHLPAEELEWGVPGLFRDKITALIKGLPKRYRKQLVPASDTAAVIERDMERTHPSLFTCLSAFVKKRFRIDIPAEAWAAAEIPDYLRVRIAVTDHKGKEIQSGRDLLVLKKTGWKPPPPQASTAWKKAQKEWEREDLKDWDFGDLPDELELGRFLVAYPGLEADGERVNIRLFDSRQAAADSTEAGVEALLLRRFRKDLEFTCRYLRIPEEYESEALYFGGRKNLEDALARHLGQEVFRRFFQKQDKYLTYANQAVNTLFEKGHILMELTLRVLDEYRKTLLFFREIEQKAKGGQSVLDLQAGLKRDLVRIVPKDFLDRYRMDRLSHLPRYLEALRIRLERGKNDPDKDARKAANIAVFEGALAQLEAESGKILSVDSALSVERRKALEELRWMLEEFRVNQFAPELKTAFPISAKRLQKKLSDIDGMS